MKRTEQVNSIATQSITPRRKRRASRRNLQHLRADVNLIVNRKFAQTLEKKFFDATFALALELQQGNSQALMDGLKIYLI